MTSEIGYSVGYVHNSTLIKTIKKRNILRFPEACFTFDALHYNRLRKYFGYIKIKIKETGEIYGISAEDFDRRKIFYDYGNGQGFRVAIEYWTLQGKQLELIE